MRRLAVLGLVLVAAGCGDEREGGRFLVYTKGLNTGDPAVWIAHGDVAAASWNR